MNNTYPLKLTVLPDGNHLITTAQGNHYATTYDPQAAAQIMALPDLVRAGHEAVNYMGEIGNELYTINERTTQMADGIVPVRNDLLLAVWAAEGGAK